MRFGVLGPVVICGAERSVVLSGRMQRTLLGVLLARANQVVGVGELIAALWGGRRVERAVPKLHLHVHRLRRLLDEPNRLCFDSEGYRLRVSSGELDADRFEAIVTEAAELGRVDPVRCVELYRKALALWRGSPYGGTDFPLLADEAHRLAERRLNVLEELYRTELALGRNDAIVGDLDELTRDHPLRESLYGLLMTALYRSGRQADALAVYRRARQHLVSELGLEPNPELRALEQRILAGEPAEPRVLAAPAQLPRAVGSFLGRDRELTELDELLAGRTGSTTPVAVLTGTGGVGKTLLAVRWAHRVRDRFPDGQLYVDLRGYGQGKPLPPAEALAGFLRALGVNGAEIACDPAERAAQFRTLVAQRRMLIVLDNAYASEQVRSLLPAASRCFVVVTSRDTLAGLVARDDAHRIMVDRLPADQALALLHELTGGLVETDPRAAAAIVERCARLPLALRVVAEQLTVAWRDNLGELADELADQQGALDLLDVDDDPATAVRAVFSWSYRQLDPSAARLFRLVGLHPGRDVDIYALAALDGRGLRETRRALDRLVRTNLIDEFSVGRYQPHDLLRAYAGELAETTDPGADREEALTRLSDYYLHGAALAMDLVAPIEQVSRPAPPSVRTPVPSFVTRQEAERWLATERSNLFAVTARAAARGEYVVATDLPAVLARYLDNEGLYQQAKVMYETALDAALQLGDQHRVAHAHRSLGTVQVRLGRLDLARDHCQAAYARYRDLGDVVGQRVLLNNLGLVNMWLGHYHEALELLEQSLLLYPEAGQTRWHTKASPLSTLGHVHAYLGNHQTALAHLAEALAAAREAGDSRREALVCLRLGFVHARMGRDIPARERLEEARDRAREIGDRPIETWTYELGRVYWRLGRREEALRSVHHCLGIAQRSGDRMIQAGIYNALGELSRLGGAHTEAFEHHHLAHGIAEDTGERYEQARAHAGLGDVHSDLGGIGSARQNWRQALTIYHTLGVPDATIVEAKLAANVLNQAATQAHWARATPRTP